MKISPTILIPWENGYLEGEFELVNQDKIERAKAAVPEEAQRYLNYLRDEYNISEYYNDFLLAFYARTGGLMRQNGIPVRAGDQGVLPFWNTIEKKPQFIIELKKREGERKEIIEDTKDRRRGRAEVREWIKIILGMIGIVGGISGALYYYRITIINIFN